MMHEQVGRDRPVRQLIILDYSPSYTGCQSDLEEIAALLNKTVECRGLRDV